MSSSKLKRKIIIILCLLVFSLMGFSFSWFNYTRIGLPNTVITGQLYLTMNSGTDTVNLTNVFPETKEEARSRDDNTITFTISGKNTSPTKSIEYEIFLNNGEDKSGKIRFDDKDLVFDLVEIGDNGEETYVLDSVSYDELNTTKIWVDRVDKNTTEDIEKTYRLRMWLSDDVIISDTDANADYAATGDEAFKNHYATVKVGVEGDLIEKELPLTVTSNDNLVSNDHSYVVSEIVNDDDIENVYNLTITSSNSNVQFVYDSSGNNLTNISTNGLSSLVKPLVNEEFDGKIKKIDNTIETLNTFNKEFHISGNKKLTFNVELVPKNGKSGTTDLSFTLKKNGENIQDVVKHVKVGGLKYTIEYTDKVAVYSGNPVQVDNVVVKNPDGTVYNVNYSKTFYNGDNCSGTKLNSAPVSVGVYSEKITVPAGDKAEETSVCAKINIARTTTTINISSTGGTYNGNPIPVVVDTNLNVEVRYYTNNTCTNLIDANNETKVPVNAGVYYAKASITDTQNYDYAESACTRHEISRKTLNESAASVNNSNLVYNGESKEPGVTIIDGNYTLVEGTDYDVVYSNNTNAGEATVTITLKGNYTGTITKTFNISKATITIPSSPEDKVYNGTSQNHGVIIPTGASIVTNGSNLSATDVGNYKVIVKINDTSNYEWTDHTTANKEIPWKIVSYNSNTLTATLAFESVTYNGESKEPGVTVKNGNTTLVAGTDYDVTYSNNTNAGEATVTITLKGNYSGTITKHFTINKATITIPNSPADKTYNKGSQAHGVTIPSHTSIVTTGSNLTATNVGNYKVIVKLDDTTNYKWSDNTITNKEVSWKILAKNANTLTSTLAFETVTYNGNNQEPGVTVKDGNTSLIEGTDYDIAYTNNKNAGEATVTITLKGNYTGTITEHFTINKAVVNIPNSPADKAYTAGSQNHGVNIPTHASIVTTGSNLTGTNVDTYKVIVKLDDTTNYKWNDNTITNKEISWKIVKSNSTTTLANINKTYNGDYQEATGATSKLSSNNQTITGATYSYTYYSNNDCSTVTTTPKNSGTYYVKATLTGTGNYNSSTSNCATYTISQKKATITLGTTPSVILGTNSELSYTYDGDGTISCASSNSSYATCSVDTTNHKIVIHPVAATTSNITITVSAGGGTNYSAPDNKTATITIAKGTCNPPSNVTIGTDGKVSWTASSNATSYQVCVVTGNSTCTPSTTFTSGSVYNAITDATGTRKVFVHSVCNSTNYNTPSESVNKSTTVYSLTLTKGNGISSVTGAGNYITGSTASIDATVMTGFTWSNWTGTSTINNKSTSITMDGNKSYTANASGNTYTATFYYQSNTTNGSTTVASTTAQCVVGGESGTCTVTIPESVRNSVGTYNNAYYGLSESAGNMTVAVNSGLQGITINGNKSYYALYSSEVTIYYPSSTSAVANKKVYRNQWLSNNSTMADTVLATTATGLSSNATAGSTVTGYSNLVGFSTSANTNTASYVSLNALKTSDATTVYQIDSKEESVNATFYYSTDTDGTKGSTTASGTKTTYLRCTSQSAAGTNVEYGSCTVPSLTGETAPYGTVSTGWATANNTMTASDSITCTLGNSYYKVYRTDNVKIYYPNTSSAVSSITVYRNAYYGSETKYSVVLASTDSGTSNVSDVSTLTGYSLDGYAHDYRTTTVDYNTIQDAANSSYSSIYAVDSKLVTPIFYYSTDTDGTVGSVTGTPAKYYVYCYNNSTASSKSTNISAPTINDEVEPIGTYKGVLFEHSYRWSRSINSMAVSQVTSAYEKWYRVYQNEIRVTKPISTSSCNSTNLNYYRNAFIDVASPVVGTTKYKKVVASSASTTTDDTSYDNEVSGYNLLGFATTQNIETITFSNLLELKNSSISAVYAVLGKSVTGTFYYSTSSNGDVGSKTASGTQYIVCYNTSALTKNSNLTPTINDDVAPSGTSSVGWASSANSMTIDLPSTASNEWYEIYRSGVRIYKPDSTSTCNYTNTEFYRNAFYVTGSTYTKVLSSNYTGTTDDATYTSEVSGYSVLGYATSANTNTIAFADLASLKNSTITSVYAVLNKTESENATFYYSNSATGAKTSTTASGTKTTYLICTNQSTASTNVTHGNCTVPSALSDEVAPYSTTSVGWATANNTMTASTTPTCTTGNSYYKVYNKNNIKIYYPRWTDTMDGMTLNRNSYYGSNDTYTTVLASSATDLNNTSNPTVASGYSFYGYATGLNSNVKTYDDISDVAKSDETSVYAIGRKSVTPTFYYSSDASGTVTSVSGTSAYQYLVVTSVGAGAAWTINTNFTIPTLTGEVEPTGTTSVGWASSNTSMSTATPSTSSAKWYKVYRNTVTVYKPISSSSCDNTNTVFYRNAYVNTSTPTVGTTKYNTVLSTTNTGTSNNASYTSGVSGYSVLGYSDAAETTSVTYDDLNELRDSSTTTAYAVLSKSESENATFYYSNSATGDKTSTTASGTKTSYIKCNNTSAANGSVVHGSCTTPTTLTGEVAPYGTTDAGWASNGASSTSGLTSTPTCTTGKSYHKVYRSSVSIYRPNTASTVSSATHYRVAYYGADTKYTVVLGNSSGATSNASNSAVADGYTFYGYAINPGTNTRTYTGIADAATGTETTLYAIGTKNANVVFYYSNNASGVKTNSSVSGTQYLVCNNSSTSSTIGDTITAPNPSSTTAPYGTSLVGWAVTNNSMTTRVPDMSSLEYYAVYREPITDYYYNGNVLDSRTIYRNGVYGTGTNYSMYLSLTTNGLNDYSYSNGPGNSSWVGLSESSDTTVEYQTVLEAAYSSCEHLYSVYMYSVSYEKGANVSSIGSEHSSCKICAHGAGTGGETCTVTLPSITPNTGYSSVGWNTTSGATTGTPALETYTLNSNPTTLYANAIANTLVFSGKTITKTYSESSQTETNGVNAATGGSGTYTYAITSGNSNNYFSLNGRDLAISGSTPANTTGYNITITATDSATGATKDATYTIIINQRSVYVTDPTVVSSTLTYSGNAQTLLETAGSCTTGGTMYWKVTTSSTPPEFATSSWISSNAVSTLKGTNAGTYYIWYYCYVEDTTNNKGNYINTSLSVSKAIGKYTPTLAISATSGSVNYGSTNSFTATPTTISDCVGTLTATSASSTYVTVSTSSSGTYAATASYSSSASGTAKTFYYKGAGVPSSGTTNVTVSYVPTSTTNCNSAATKANAITVNKVNATCPTITDWTGTYDGSQHSIGVSGGSGGTIQYKWNSTSDSWRNTLPTASTSGTYKTYVQVLGDGNHNTVDCSYKTLTINQRTVTVTAPTAASGTFTYSGSAQTIISAAGSCTTGGTMYWYGVPTTTSTAPSFSTSTWTTTAPARTATDAGTYYYYYYCYVSDTTNNIGSDINSVKSVSKAIGKYTPTLAISATTGSVNYGATSSFTATPTTISGCVGTLTATSASSTYVTVSTSSSGTYAATASYSSSASGTAKTFYYKGAGVPSSGTTNVTVSYVPTSTTNCNSAATKANAITVNKVNATCPTVTGYSGTYDGSGHYVTVTGGSGGTIKYEKSIDSGSTYTDQGTSSPARVSAGTTYVRVRVEGDGNHNNVTCDTKTITLAKRTVTVTAPTAASGTFTYSGSAQTIISAAGSCTTGGTMYWYGVPTTTSTAPSFSTSTWTTTAPARTATGAGTYYYYYYCYVSDTGNNTGTNINTVNSVSKAIGKYTPSITLSATSGSVAANATNTFTATPTTISGCQGTLTAASANTSYVTITGGASNSNVSNGTAKTITYKGISYTTGTNVNVNYAPSSTANCNNATQKTFSVSVTRLTPTVSLTAKTADYTGNAIAANTATATYGGSSVSLSYTYKYYTNSSCSTGETTTAPTNAGQYYARATSTQTGVYASANSSCVSHKINKITPTLTLSASSGKVEPGGTNSFTEKGSVAGGFANSSSATGVATVSPASYSGVAANTAKTVTITGVNGGTATLTSAFTPTDTTNYNSTSKTYSLSSGIYNITYTYTGDYSSCTSSRSGNPLTYSNTATYGQTYTVVDNWWTCPGYTFLGWTANSDLTDDGVGGRVGWSGTWVYKNGQIGISNYNLVIYARWEKITYWYWNMRCKCTNGNTVYASSAPNYTSSGDAITACQTNNNGVNTCQSQCQAQGSYLSTSEGCTAIRSTS